MANNKATGPATFMSMGVFIGLGAAAGIVLGAILGELVLWMGMGAGVGVVAGAIFEANRASRPSSQDDGERDRSGAND